MVRLASFFCLAVATLASASPILKKRAGDPIAGQYIITFKPEGTSFTGRNVDALIADVLAKAEQSAGGNSFAASNELLRKFDFGSGQFQGFAAKLPEAALNAIKSHPEVEVVEPDTIVTLDGTQRGLDNGLWGIDVLDGARDGSYTYPDEAGAGVDAYVIDTGIRVQHPDFQGRAKWGFSADGSNTDGNGHGTHVAGTIGGATYGVAKKVNLIAVAVLGADGSGSTSDVVAGMNYVANQARSGRKSVANMSLGGGKATAIDRAARGLISAGVALAVAAGNSAKDSCSGSPSGVAEALTVAASDINNRFASFSEYGRCVDIIAPGVNIKSAWNNGGVKTISGTSMATPHVAGALAIAYSQRNFGSPAEAFNFLLSKAATGKISGAPSGTPNKFLQL